ncbi:TPA: hypothetical protein ACQSO4_000237 [Pseudomonas aeruginosa]
MIEQLKAMLEQQRVRLRQLEKLSYTGRIADGLRAQVSELCRSLEEALETAEFLETQKAAESELYARFAE